MLDKAVGCRYNLRIGAVILIHHKLLCPRMLLCKIKQCLRISRAESVNTLILVSHHEKISLLSCQKPDNNMLDFGRILCLIHTDIPVLFLIKFKKRRAPFQHPVRINHLIIIVHEAVLL